MKKLILAVIVLVIFIAGSLWIEFKLNDSVENLLADIQTLTDSVKNEQWNNVDTGFEDIVNKWEERVKTWSMILDHKEIDQLTIALYKAKTYANFREKEEALAEFKQFEFMIDHIPKTHKIELKNIL